MNDKTRIFFVEDDLPFGGVLKTFLELNDYVVDWITDGRKAIEMFKPETYGIAILDVMLPNADGFEVASSIRKKDVRVPMVFMTAKTMKEDMLKGYRTGADDYITKPFDTEVLLLKIEAILKRKSNNTIVDNAWFAFGNCRFDLYSRELTCYTEVHRLSPREAELLKLLIENKNNLVSRSEVLNRLWGNDDYFNGRSMDVFIARLRKYLANDAKIEIRSIPRSGYIMQIKQD